MFRHCLLIIYRNFRRHQSSFYINLIGLSTGLACTLLIYLWVNDELSFDRFHEHEERLFQVMRTNGGNDVFTTGSNAGVLAQTLAAEMPEVEYATSVGINLPENKILSTDKKDLRAKGMYVGQDFFHVFTFPLIEGNPVQVFLDPNAIAISDEMAIKLFGSTERVVGKTLKFHHTGTKPISAVFKKPPLNSSLQFDFVLSHEGMIKDNPGMGAWDNNYTGTFLTLKEGTRLDLFNDKIKDLITRKSEVKNQTLSLRPFSERYLYDKYENGVQAGGRIEYVRLFSLIACFILLIACINFMNLSTARASHRLKEVGVKKALGADRQTLIHQYLGESLLMAFISLLVALWLVFLLLPQFNNITGKQLSLPFTFRSTGALLAITIVTGLLSGSYPALYLSGFQPIRILRGNVMSKLSTSVGERWARRGLVTFQFSLSVIFIVSVLVVYKQIEFVQKKNLGYDKDHVIAFEREGQAQAHLQTFLTEVKKIPGVVDGSSLLRNFVGPAGSLNKFDWEGKSPTQIIDFEYRIVNYGFIEMLGIPLKEGKSFTPDMPADNTKIIFNEAAIKVMGLRDPVGKTVKFMGNDHQIIGVVKDFHFASLHQSVNPLFFYLVPEATSSILVKIQAGRENETLDRLQEFYAKFNPGYSFDYTFLDQDYQALYASEQRVSLLSRYFAGLAILISCLGLFGLATFTAERRRKEIGIRKVFGSSEWRIVYLLSIDFTKIVLLAITLALPISYLLMQHWLEGFEYRIPLRVGYFMGAGLLALCIAWITVGFQAFKAARLNPVQALRDE